jgi:hypothetical protein
MDGFKKKLTILKFLIDFFNSQMQSEIPYKYVNNLSISDNIHLNLNEVQTNVGQFSLYLENHWFQFLEEIRKTNLTFELFLFSKNLYMF